MISKEDRILIERHVLLPYTLHYLNEASNEAKSPIEKYSISVFQKLAQQEQSRIRNELRKRKITVKSEKGWYRAEVGGEIIEDRMDSATVKAKAEAILMEYLKRAPG